MKSFANLAPSKTPLPSVMTALPNMHQPSVLRAPHFNMTLRILNFIVLLTQVVTAKSMIAFIMGALPAATALSLTV